MARNTKPSAKTGEAIIELREKIPGRGNQRASAGLPSNRQSSRPEAASYARNQPSPPPKSTRGRPFTIAAAGLDHSPCRIDAPAPMARQTTSPDLLFTAIKLGARGDGTRV